MTIASVGILGFAPQYLAITSAIPIIYLLKCQNWRNKELGSIQGIGIDRDEGIYFLFFNPKYQLVWKKFR